MIKKRRALILAYQKGFILVALDNGAYVEVETELKLTLTCIGGVIRVQKKNGIYRAIGDTLNNIATDKTLNSCRRRDVKIRLKLWRGSNVFLALNPNKFYDKKHIEKIYKLQPGFIAKGNVKLQENKRYTEYRLKTLSA